MERLLKRLPLNRLMDLKVDFAFKQLFGHDKNKHITIIFLNAILKREGDDRIQDITFVNTEFSGEHESDKESRLDILATTNKNERVNIEIQFNNRYDMVKRSLYYWANIYRNTIASGLGYRELKPVIMINLMNFNLFKQTEKFHTTYHIVEDEERFQLTDVLEIQFFEMPKLLKAWKEGKLNPRNDLLARWVLLLGMVDKKNHMVYEDIYNELEEISMNDPQLREAFQDWEKLSADTDKWYEYEARAKVIMDDLAAVREAELREKEAREKGLAEGHILRLITSIKQFLQVRSPETLTEQVQESLANTKDSKKLEELQLELFSAMNEHEIKAVVAKFSLYGHKCRQLLTILPID